MHFVGTSVIVMKFIAPRIFVDRGWEHRAEELGWKVNVYDENFDCEKMVWVDGNKEGKKWINIIFTEYYRLNLIILYDGDYVVEEEAIDRVVEELKDLKEVIYGRDIEIILRKEKSKSSNSLIMDADIMNKKDIIKL